MDHPIDNFYLSKEEPLQGTLLALRDMIMKMSEEITAEWKYGMPFFCIRGKMCCYLWVQKKTLIPYIGIVDGNKIDHPDLIQEKRSRMKILLVDPTKDLPVRKIEKILKEVISNKLSVVSKKD